MRRVAQRASLVLSLLAACVLFAGVAPRTASAQATGNSLTPGLGMDLQLFRPAIDSKGYVTVNASQVLGHKDFSLGLVGTWAGNPLTLQLSPGEVDPQTGQAVVNGRNFAVNNLVTAQLQFALGLWKYFEIGVGLPLSIMTGNRQVCTPNGNGGSDCHGTVKGCEPILGNYGLNAQQWKKFTAAFERATGRPLT